LARLMRSGSLISGIAAGKSGRPAPNDDAIVRLVGAILLEQNDEWAVQRAHYMTLETIAALSDDPVRWIAGYGDLTDPAHAGDRRGQPASATPRSGTSSELSELLAGLDSRHPFE
jgi:hypothetical protein